MTGSSSGLGRACALRLAEKGYRVFAGVRRDSDGESLRRETAGALVPLLLDVTRPEAIEAAAARCADAGGLDALVNNAGITVAGPLELLPMEEIRRQFEVNLFGQIALTRAFLPQLRTSAGRVVMMGSILGRLSVPFLAPYAATKSALAAVADSLASELKEWGISVVLVEPGNIATPIWTKTRTLARATFEGLEEDRWELYRERLEGFDRYVDEAAVSGIAPRRVATAVERALAARRPRHRYTVGWDSRVLGGLAPIVPARLRQLLVRRVVLRR